ncbi:hypothetical protein M5D96_008705 [Drosophila gunungcola]|uniref:Uncharacterized protein n=1 Tax=Drosophila gunungcola TaxID=103775 RepID=A0A9Q0BNK0_9MUSC|nr:hypothetical protein M5D96_008705 [Drosophila gunungcola]
MQLTAAHNCITTNVKNAKQKKKNPNGAITAERAADCAKAARKTNCESQNKM